MTIPTTTEAALARARADGARAAIELFETRAWVLARAGQPTGAAALQDAADYARRTLLPPDPRALQRRPR